MNNIQIASCKSRIISDEYASWIENLANWRYFVTLTFRADYSQDNAMDLLKRLIQVLNKDLFGNHYTRKVGHSYFSYVACHEYQTMGNIHFHLLVDSPINWILLDEFWMRNAGKTDVAPIRNQAAAARYICKQASRNGEIHPPFISEKNLLPKDLPPWWA